MTQPPAPSSLLSDADTALLERLRERDERAFVELLEQYHAPLVRFLRGYVPTQDLAEDVAQETWVAFLQGLERFKGQAALKTWIFRIGANRAQSRMRKERRSIPFSFLRSRSPDGDDEAFDLDRYLPGAFSPATKMWTSVPDRWDADPESRLTANETIAVVRETISQLPAMQASVITLRDIENWTSAEVREALGLSEANQRVLLHRARVRVRKALEAHFAEARR